MKPQLLLSETSTGTDPVPLVIAASNLIEPLFAAALADLGTVTRVDGLPAADCHLLVIDAARSSLSQFEAQAATACALLERNCPVLILRPTRTHKRLLAQARVTRHYVDSDCVALLVEPRRDTAGALRIGLAEQYARVHGIATWPLSAGAAPDANAGPTLDDIVVLASAPSATDPEPADLVPFLERLRCVVTRLAAGDVLPLFDATSGFAQPNQPDVSIPSNLWNTQPIAWYQPVGLGMPNSSFGDGSKAANSSALLQGLTTLGVYYDNSSYSKPVQWLIIEHSLSLSLPYNPTTTNGLVKQDSQDQGWSIGSLQIAGSNISASNLVSNQSTPQNANNVETYTSSSNFHVGLTAGTDGLRADVGYNVGSSVTNSISQWAVQKTAPDNWTFYQQTPFDGRNTTSWPDGADGKKGAPVFVGPIAAGELDVCAQTVWLRTPADTATLQNYYLFQANFFWYHADHHGNLEMASWSPFLGWNFMIDFGSAFPSA